MPGAALVRASFDRPSAFTSVDLPTFERPTRASSATPSAGHLSGPTALVTNDARSFTLIASGQCVMVSSGASTPTSPATGAIGPGSGSASAVFNTSSIVWTR